MPSPKEAKASTSVEPAVSLPSGTLQTPNWQQGRKCIVERRPDRQRGRGKRENSEGSLKQNKTLPQGRSLLSPLILSLEKVLAERYPERGINLFSSDQPKRGLKRQPHWRDGSVIKSPGCVYRGCEFDSRHLHEGSQLPETLVPGDPAPPWCLWIPGTCVLHRHTFRQNTNNFKN